MRRNRALADGSGSVPVIGKPVELFTVQDAVGNAYIAPDGRFFYVMNEEATEDEPAPVTKGIVLIENWLSRFAK